MKKSLIFLITIFFFASTKGQQVPLMAHEDPGGNYLIHTVAAKENWYSIGRIYGISPKEIAPFNHTTIEKSLSVGQTLRIPLSPTNFVQSGAVTGNQVLVPVYHAVREKEGLFRISQTFNKVPIDKLKSWNKLATDEIPLGMNLVVGYLKVDKTQSSLAKMAQSPPSQPVAKQDVPPPAKENQPSVRQVPPPVEKPGDVRKGEQVNIKTDTSPAQRTGTSVDNTGGVFKSLFNEQTKSGSIKSQLSGQAAAFKSTSGWKDGKYYALMNRITAGTVIKVTNKSNGRSIYAKVLGELPPGNENEGLIIRISNAAASDLQVLDTRFDVDLEWMK